MNYQFLKSFHKTILTLLVLINGVFSPLYAQYKPGGLSTPSLWFNLDGKTANTSLGTWDNSGSLGGSLTSSTTSLPVVQINSAEFNGKPTLYFNGSNRLIGLTSNLFNVNNSFLIVMKTSSGNILNYVSNANQSSQFLTFQFSSPNIFRADLWCPNKSTTTLFPNFSSSPSNIYLSKNNGILFEGINGGNYLSDNYSTFNCSDLSALSLGGFATANAVGNIAEIIAFEASSFNPTKKVILDKYLSLKFGIPLDPANYGVGLFDYYSNFNNELLGIGRRTVTVFSIIPIIDDSKESSASSSLITITDNDLQPNEYAFIADNNLSTDLTATDNPVNVKRMNKTWRIQTTNAGANSKLSFKFNDISKLPIKSWQYPVMLIDADGVFGDDTKVIALKNDGNGYYYYDELTVPSGSYISFGVLNQVTDLAFSDDAVSIGKADLNYDKQWSDLVSQTLAIGGFESQDLHDYMIISNTKPNVTPEFYYANNPFASVALGSGLRSTSVWKVKSYGNFGKGVVRFLNDFAAYTIPDDYECVLLIDTDGDGDFTTGTDSYGMVQEGSTNYYGAYNVELKDGNLLALAIVKKTVINGKVQNLEANFSGATLNLNATSNIITTTNYNFKSASSCTTEVKSAYLKLVFNTGDIHTLGGTDFNATVTVKVEGFTNFDLTGSPAVTYNYPLLAIDASKPEVLYTLNVSKDFVDPLNEIKTYRVTVIGLTFPTLSQPLLGFVSGLVKLKVSLSKNILTYTPQTDLTTINSLAITGGDVKTFSWTSNNCGAPSYQFQLLRLYNNDPTKTGLYSINAEIDWSKALTLETSNSSISLTMAEGSGYYTWRVRPIGNKYSGGVSDSRNWGTWSRAYTDRWDFPIKEQEDIISRLDLNVPDGATVSQVNNYYLQNYSGKVFYYSQFDSDKNYIYNRAFTEDAKIHEGISYANGLGQIKQTQAHVPSNYEQTNTNSGEILVNQTLYDYSGRSALVTIPAPAMDNNNKLGYRNNFLQNTGNLYTAKNFDEDTKLNNPDITNAGLLNQYYTDNTDPSIPNADGFPFTRTLFHKDGSGRVAETSGVGATHAIGKGHTNTVFFGTVSKSELVRIFGDEAPDESTVFKSYTKDQNNIVNVTYTDKFGKTLATCLSGTDTVKYPTNLARLNSDDKSLSEFTVNELFTNKNNKKYGSYGLIATKQFTFTETTDISLSYNITPAVIKSACGDYCSKCAYKLKIYITDLNNPGEPKDSIIKNITGGTITASATCASPEVESVAISPSVITLESGNYKIDKIIELDQAAAANYAKNIVTQINTELSVYSESIKVFLDKKDFVGLNDYLKGLQTSPPANIWIEVKDDEGLLIYSKLNPRKDKNGNSLTSTIITNFKNGYEVAIISKCCTIRIPIIYFPIEPCEDPAIFTKEAFGDFLIADIAKYKDKNGVTLTIPNISKQRYTDADFKILMTNLLSESTYNLKCTDVYNCWQGILLSLVAPDIILSAEEQAQQQTDNDKQVSDVKPKWAKDNNVNPSAQDIDYIDKFLDCIGRHYEGVTNDATKGLLNAYKWIYYDQTKTNVRKQACEEMFCNTLTVGLPAEATPVDPIVLQPNDAGYIPPCTTGVCKMNFVAASGYSKISMFNNTTQINIAPGVPDIWDVKNANANYGKLFEANYNAFAGCVKNAMSLTTKPLTDADIEALTLENKTKAETECRSSCDSYYSQFYNQLRNAYGMNTDAVGQKFYNPDGEEITEADVCATAAKMVQACKDECRLTIQTYNCSGVNKIIGVGTKSELATVASIIGGSFELQIKKRIEQCTTETGFKEAWGCIQGSYTFDKKPDGTYLYDISGRNYTLVASGIGVSLITGHNSKLNSALNIPSSVKLTVPSTSVGSSTDVKFTNKFTNKVTISAWVNATGAREIVSKFTSGGKGFYLSVNAFGKAEFGGNDGTGTGTKTAISTNSVVGAWHHIAGVYSLGIWTVYVDGVLAGTAGTLTYNTTDINNTIDLIVANNNGTYAINIDELGIYNCALDATEIASLANVNYVPVDYTITPAGCSDIRIDPNSPYIKWNKVMSGGGTSNELYKILNTSDGCQIFVGHVKNGTSVQSIYITKINSSGVVLWERSYADGFYPSLTDPNLTKNIEEGYIRSKWEIKNNVILGSDNSLIIGGNSSGFNSNITDLLFATQTTSDGRPFLMKIDLTTGKIISGRCYGINEGGDFINAVVELSNNVTSKIDYFASFGLTSTIWKIDGLNFAANLKREFINSSNQNEILSLSILENTININYKHLLVKYLDNSTSNYGFYNAFINLSDLSLISQDKENTVGLLNNTSYYFDNINNINSATRQSIRITYEEAIKNSFIGNFWGYSQITNSSFNDSRNLFVKIDYNGSKYISIGGYENLYIWVDNNTQLPFIWAHVNQMAQGSGGVTAWTRSKNYVPGNFNSYLSSKGGNYIYAGHHIDLNPLLYTIQIGTFNATGLSYGRNDDVFILKSKDDLSTIWQRSFGGANVDRAYNIVELANGDLLVGGTTNSPSGANSDVTGKTTNSTDYWAFRISFPTIPAKPQSVCIKWKNDPVIITDLPPSKTPEKQKERVVREIKEALEIQLTTCKSENYDFLLNDYKSQCLGTTIQDEFKYSYKLRHHHYTLFYFDRAGQLVKTVPPKGVNTLDVSNPTGNEMNRKVAPQHRLVTYYQYNSLGQMVQQITPDGGITNFIYNNKGQLRFSQNAKQLKETPAKYSYTKYDYLGRAVEVGISVYPSGVTSFAGLDNNAYVNDMTIPTVGNTEQTITVFSEAAQINYLSRSQRYLLNRVSYTFTYNLNGDRTVNYYSYDPHGNVEWMVQEIPGIGKSTIGYEYDLISNKVLKVKFNEQLPGQYFHKYDYDADNRLIAAYTSANGEVWDKDAGYKYFKHGPLKRTEIGEDKIQALDYTYTLHGWLKSINGFNDATGEFMADEYGMTLNYYDNDFSRGSFQYNSPKPLYNGNISAWTTVIKNKCASPDCGISAQAYEYDQLNRILKSDYLTYHQSRAAEDIPWVMPGATSDKYYHTEYSYDANGNILTLKRNGNDATNPIMDDLVYKYDKTNTAVNGKSYDASLVHNKLNYVVDNTSLTNAATYPTDIETQLGDNYTYDPIGNLVTDANGKIAKITWNNYGKISEIKPVDNSTPHLVFSYNPAGQRVKKEVISLPTYDANGKVIKTPDRTAGTYYIRDASGNTMAVFERKNVLISGSDYKATFKIKERSIYGSSRLGLFAPTNLSNSDIVNVSFTMADFDKVTINSNEIARLTEYPVTQMSAYDIYAGSIPRSTISDITPGTAAVDVSTPRPLYFQGKVTENISTALDKATNSTKAFTSFTCKYFGVDNTCLVLDKNNKLMPNADGLKSDSKTQSVIIGRPAKNNTTQNSEYYLITMNAGNIYRHTVDLSVTGTYNQGNVTAKNVLINANSTFTGMFTGSFQVIEDIEKNKAYLYATAFVPTTTGAQTGTLYVLRFAITNASFQSQPDILATVTDAMNVKGFGQMKISPDGRQFMLTNYKKKAGWFNHQDTELIIYELTADFKFIDNQLVNTQKIKIGETLMGAKAEFSASDALEGNSRFIYYTRLHTVFKTANQPLQMYRYDERNTSFTAPPNTYGDLSRRRQGTTGQVCVITALTLNSTLYYQQLNGVAVETVPYLTTNRFHINTSSFPISNHKIFNTPPAYAGSWREINSKSYEISDHLGNVTVVLGDRRSVSTGGTPYGIIYPKANLISATQYYPFGMPMDGLGYVKPTGYRYGFNGKENDDETSTQDFGARMFDARLGRFMSIDPDYKKYPHFSPYLFAGNSPLVLIDIEGKGLGDPVVSSRCNNTGNLIIVLVDSDKIDAKVQSTNWDYVAVTDMKYAAEWVAKNYSNGGIKDLVIIQHGGVDDNGKNAIINKNTEKGKTENGENGTDLIVRWKLSSDDFSGISTTPQEYKQVSAYAQIFSSLENSATLTMVACNAAADVSLSKAIAKLASASGTKTGINVLTNLDYSYPWTVTTNKDGSINWNIIFNKSLTRGENQYGWNSTRYSNGKLITVPIYYFPVLNSNGNVTGTNESLPSTLSSETTIIQKPRQ